MVTSDSIKIAEIPSRIWNFNHYFQLPVDRSGITVKEYLSQRNIVWRFGDDPSADFRVYKEENLRNGLLSFRRLKNEFQKRIEKKPYINLNGEAQENSKISYLLADPDRTFSVAPGDKFKRLYFPSLWSDPQIEHWEERSDRICWIGRPLPDRIRLAKKSINWVSGWIFTVVNRGRWRTGKDLLRMNLIYPKNTDIGLYSKTA
jgi:hypothetical protein